MCTPFLCVACVARLLCHCLCSRCGHDPAMGSCCAQRFCGGSGCSLIFPWAMHSPSLLYQLCGACHGHHWLCRACHGSTFVCVVLDLRSNRACCGLAV